MAPRMFRYIVAWKLCTTMAVSDVTETLAMALQTSGLDQAAAERRPRLLSDNGHSYIATELSGWLKAQGMLLSSSRPYHSMT